MIKVAVKINRELVRSAYDQNLVCTPELEIGKFTVIEAQPEGMVIPNVVRVFDDIESAAQNAVAKNRQMGISPQQAEKFLKSVSGGILTSKKQFE